MVARPQIKPVGITQRFMNAAFIAEAGFGKSVLLGSPDKKMIILSMDPEGADSAFFQGSKAEEIVVRTFEELNSAYLWLREEGHKEYEYVGLDSAPEAQKILQLDWLEKNRTNAGKRHPDVLGIDGYQITQNQFIKMVKQFNDLPMHTVYTAKPAEHADAEGNAYYLPNLHGQKGDIARDFMGYMKIQGFGVYHTKKVKKANGEIVDKDVRRYYFSPQGPYRGKDRTDSLGSYIDDPTLPQIAKMIEDRAEEQTRRAPAKKTAAPRSRRTRA